LALTKRQGGEKLKESMFGSVLQGFFCSDPSNTKLENLQRRYYFVLCREFEHSGLLILMAKK
jgi:hypothetical protein